MENLINDDLDLSPSGESQFDNNPNIGSDSESNY